MKQATMTAQELFNNLRALDPDFQPEVDDWLMEGHLSVNLLYCGGELELFRLLHANGFVFDPRYHRWMPHHGEMGTIIHTVCFAITDNDNPIDDGDEESEEYASRFDGL